MARQDSYYPYRPNYATEVGMVYNPIDLSAANEIVAQQLGQRSQMYQQNLDAIAAAENEMESQKFRDVDRPGINVRLQNFSKDIDDMVKNQYQGDYAMARKDILRKIAKERGEINRATQRYELEQKYLPIKQDLINKGKLVVPKGTLDPFSTAMYDTQGNYVPGTDDYSQMYERNDYDKWVKENISDRINNTISDNYEQTLAGADKGKNAFLVMLKRKGMDRNAFLNQVRQDADKYISDDDVKAFLSYNPTYAMEFGNDINAARNYLNTTTARHISEQVDRSLTANPYWKSKAQDGTGNEGLNYWQSLGDVLKINSPQKTALGLNDKYFDASGKYTGKITTTVPMTEKEHKDALGTVIGGLAPAGNIAAGLKEVPSDDDGNLKKIDDFRNRYSLKGLSDKDTWKLMNKVENKINEDFGTIWRVPETDKSSMNAITGNVFYNEKNNGFGDFVNRDIWINGEKITDEDKVRKLKDEFGVSSDKEFIDKLKSINGSITFTGSSPSSIIGYVSTKSGRQLRIEVSNTDQIAKEGNDMFEISDRLRKGNKDKFTLVNRKGFRDPSTGDIKIATKASVDMELVPDPTGELQPIPVVVYYDDKDNELSKDSQLGIFGDIARKNITPWITIPQ